jgi:hypothetical protein
MTDIFCESRNWIEASPKSQIFTSTPPPGAVLMSTFGFLRSRCAIPWSCKHSMPRQIWLMTEYNRPDCQERRPIGKSCREVSHSSVSR